jgi:excisionase family DNA binding protein
MERTARRGLETPGENQRTGQTLIRTREDTMQPDRVTLTMSVPEAADLLGISRAFAYVLVARGDLPGLRLGRRVVVPRRALEQLIEKADQPVR